MSLRGRGVRAVVLATALGLQASMPARAASGTILWDQYAVPHIYGADIPTVVRGLAYAQMENHAETLLNNVARARGRSAEYFGVGPSNFNLNYDIRVRRYGIPQRAALWVQQGGSFQQTVLQAFCDGVNEYATKHPTDILPQLKPILPVVPTDITAGELNTINWTFLVEQDGVPGLVGAWLAGGMDGVRALKPIRKTEGSNGWALAPAKTTDGNTILMGNPHLPWGVNQPIDDDQGNQNFGVYQWVEANLVVGDPNNPTLNASGVTFVGGPFIGVGFSDKVGWTHTNNTIQNADLYQLTLDSTGTKYLYGGQYLPLLHTVSTIKILQTNGSYTTQKVDLYASIHGPVVAFNAGRTQALALRVAGLNQTSLVTQYWNMIQAQNVTQFMAAQSALQMPFFNTMMADSSGNIFYGFGGQQPVRNGGTAADYFNTILDGTDPTKLWTKTFTYSQLPHVVNPPGHWVANSNNPPWTSAIPQPNGLNPANYPAYVAPSEMDFRPQHGATFLSTTGKLDAARVLAGKMSTEMYLADRIGGDVINFATQAAQGGDTVAGEAATILSAWDHTADQDSPGGSLFEQFWLNVIADIEAGKIVPDASLAFNSPHPKFITPWDPANPLTTPTGLDPVNQAALVADLDAAYATVAANFASAGGAAVKWGDAHKTTLVFRSGATQTLAGIAANAPLSGADDEFGPLRVVNDTYVGSFGEFISYGGDGYVQVIEFTPNGSVGGTLLTYGNASRPNSPHIADQVPFFETKTLKPALRTYSAVQAAAVAQEGY
jgi:acyl-homoserine-lactone acylase